MQTVNDANKLRPAPPEEKSGVGPRLRKVLFAQESILALILLLIVLLLATQSDRFLTTRNLLNQTRFFTETALIALPMTLIIITGGIDLSVGSTLALSAVMLGFSWKFWGLPLELAVAVCLLTGIVAGLFNGLVIVYLKVPPLIVTLATLAIYRGFSFGISQSQSVTSFPEGFAIWGSGDVGGIPTQLIILVIATLIVGVVLARTPFGRYIYAIGNNELGARFAGINVNRVKLLIYTFAGFMAGVAGFIFTSRVLTTRADAATGVELDVIAAVVLGGTSIFGGSGSILGTILGVLIIQLLRNGLQLAGVTGDSTVIVIGFVLIAALLINNALRRRTVAR